MDTDVEDAEDTYDSVMSPRRSVFEDDQIQMNAVLTKEAAAETDRKNAAIAAAAAAAAAIATAAPGIPPVAVIAAPPATTNNATAPSLSDAPVIGGINIVLKKHKAKRDDAGESVPDQPFSQSTLLMNGSPIDMIKPPPKLKMYLVGDEEIQGFDPVGIENRIPGDVTSRSHLPQLNLHFRNLHPSKVSDRKKK